MYIAHFAVHGLLRFSDPQLGIDPDTGGVIDYVLRLSEALARTEGIQRVDVFTRRIEDSRVANSYAEHIEPIAKGANIIRLDFGPKGYILKNILWSYLDECAERAITFFKTQKVLPDMLHAHYADSAYVCDKISTELNIPYVFSVHALGKAKYRAMIEAGHDADTLDKELNIRRRIYAEEEAFKRAKAYIASSEEEVKSHFSLYDYQLDRCHLIYPGYNDHAFCAQGDAYPDLRWASFFSDAHKPILINVSRPDRTKNVESLIKIFAENAGLRSRCNLAIYMGQRDDIDSLEAPRQAFYNRILHLIDRYDLYGSIAYPKTNKREDIPAYYRYIAKHNGLYINSALSEPFGIGILEAIACGLPVVSHNSGGVTGIVTNCDSGYIANIGDESAFAEQILNLLDDSATRHRMSDVGARKAVQHYSWDVHAKKYSQLASGLL